MLLRIWLSSAVPLSLGIGPLIALTVAWKISRRPAPESPPPSVIRLAQSGPPHPCEAFCWGSASRVNRCARSRELAAHTLVAGATNAGKSTLVKRYVEGLTGLRHGLLLIDGKADPHSRRLSQTSMRRPTSGSRGGQRPLNLLGGTPSQFAAKSSMSTIGRSRIIAQINHRYALQVGTFFSLSGRPRTPANVLRLLSPEDLDAEADALAANSVGRNNRLTRNRAGDCQIHR